jgi:hypothetical protein
VRKGFLFPVTQGNIRGVYDDLDIDPDSTADVRRGFGSRPLHAVALVA